MVKLYSFVKVTNFGKAVKLIYANTIKEARERLMEQQPTDYNEYRHYMTNNAGGTK